jgi:hypothetical protein
MCSTRRIISTAARREKVKSIIRRGSAPHDEMRHTMGQRIGLAGAGTGDHQKRREAAMLDRLALFWIKPGEVRRCGHAD